MTIAVYALSGDPITFGHIQIIKKSAQSFEKLIVGIGVNASKKYLLTDDERLSIAKESLSQFPNVHVVFFRGLLVDFAFEQGATVIIRGVRNTQDFIEEQALAEINNSQHQINTFLVMSNPKFNHISSSTVKAIQKEHGSICEYVPLPTKAILEKKISEQFICGITGVMGAGKSYIADQLVDFSIKLREKTLDTQKYPLVHNIELDKLGHIIYESSAPVYQQLRKTLLQHFGTLERKEIAKIAFCEDPVSSKHHVDFLNNVFREPLKVLLRQALMDKKGIILINGALLVEQFFLNSCNNNVILVNANDEIRKKRLIEFRNIKSEDAEKRIAQMNSYNEKLKSILQQQQLDMYGKVFLYNNSPSSVDNIETLYFELIKQL